MAPSCWSATRPITALRLLGREDRQPCACPGPFERHRLLALELVPGALDGARGLLRATGRPMPQPGLAAAAA